MFTIQINDLKEREKEIIEQILGIEDNLKEAKESLTIIRKGLKSMERLQEQLCPPTDET